MRLRRKQILTWATSAGLGLLMAACGQPEPRSGQGARGAGATPTQQNEEELFWSNWLTQAANYRATVGLVGSETRVYTPVWPTQPPRPSHIPTWNPGTPSVPLRRPAGAGMIIEVGTVPGPSYFIYYNRWLQHKANYEVVVYAGRLGPMKDPSGQQGILFVHVAPMPADDTGDVLPPGSYPTPTQVGGVRIVNAIGEVLALRADNGQMLSFDVATRRYIAA